MQITCDSRTMLLFLLNKRKLFNFKLDFRHQKLEEELARIKNFKNSSTLKLKKNIQKNSPLKNNLTKRADNNYSSVASTNYHHINLDMDDIKEFQVSFDKRLKRIQNKMDTYDTTNNSYRDSIAQKSIMVKSKSPSKIIDIRQMQRDQITKLLKSKSSSESNFQWKTDLNIKNELSTQETIDSQKKLRNSKRLMISTHESNSDGYGNQDQYESKEQQISRSFKKNKTKLYNILRHTNQNNQKEVGAIMYDKYQNDVRFNHLKDTIQILK